MNKTDQSEREQLSGSSGLLLSDVTQVGAATMFFYFLSAASVVSGLFVSLLLSPLRPLLCADPVVAAAAAASESLQVVPPTSCTCLYSAVILHFMAETLPVAVMCCTFPP